MNETVLARIGERYYHVMPMTYMAGILNSIIMPFLAGQAIYVGSRFSVSTARSFWKTVERYGIDTIWLSPTMLTMIQKMDKADVGIRYCQSHEILFLIGTAALTKAVREKFEEKYRVSLFASYGLTETLFISVETEALLGKDSVGALLPGVQIENEGGELLLGVPWMFLRYINADTSQYMKGQYYRSGDLYEYRDALWITGRRKDLIVKGGMNVSPAKIEAVVMENEAIQECAVFGVMNETGDEAIFCCYVTESNEEEQLKHDINAAILERLGKNYRVDLFLRVGSIIKNTNGKADKAAMRKAYAACLNQKRQSGT